MISKVNGGIKNEKDNGKENGPALDIQGRNDAGNRHNNDTDRGISNEEGGSLD